MRPLLRPALLALWTTALVAIAANLVVVLSGTAANGELIVVDQQGMTLVVDALPTIAASIVGALLAAVGTLIIVRVLPRRGILVFVIAGAIVTLLSLFGTTAAVTATGVATLIVMHLVTGTVVVVGNAVIHSRAKGNAAVSTR
ncbi:DUF6069 family protein [Microcella humidisoli]|uniref:DUF6069 family protein n=1 Tax=Microcella humidisoli TaxID=2963406 RepID=A0ABY5FZR3_9MICO|nr:DUF6069 family protein [Microcella humidisoli]UTT63626.1 DUF6069 family protein [Microcella humidisoli]